LLEQPGLGITGFLLFLELQADMKTPVRDKGFAPYSRKLCRFTSESLQRKLYRLHLPEN
jgi:hypothetical protein